MFIILLKFSTNRDKTGEFLDGHKAWLKQGFDDGIFILAGSLQPGLGGGILASGIARDDLAALVNEDPFVAQDVVTAEIIEMTPSMADDRLKFLTA